MDILKDVSVDWIKALTWISAISTGMLLGFWRPRRLHLAALGSVIVFMVASTGAGIYVFNHVGDSRWNSKAEDRINPPTLAETPVIGQYLESLDGLMHGVADRVNEFVDFRAALPVALEFFVAAGWALVICIPLALLSLIIAYAEAKRRKTELLKHKTQLAELARELQVIKDRLGIPDLDRDDYRPPANPT